MRDIAIVGGGIAGLAFALGLHRLGIRATVYEAAPEFREVGVGITLLPHACRELHALGALERLEPLGIENLESVFFNRHGQFVYRELRGRHAGHPFPEIGIHRARLHGVLHQLVLERLGPEAIRMGLRCRGYSQTGQRVSLEFARADGSLEQADADLVVACDGVNSAVRAQMHPRDKLCFAGINTWRGVSAYPAILTGRSYLRIGTINTGKMVIYPIVDRYDDQGRQLVNWVAEIQRDDAPMNDWNTAADFDDFLPTFESWRFDWLDVPALIRASVRTHQYPMVDRDPLPFWRDGRVTLMGDAAHPMYPRGSNGSAQSMIDARVLSEAVAGASDPLRALDDYEAARREATGRVVMTNRSQPPDFIIMKADELSGGKPFRHIDDLISQEELRGIAARYEQVAGFARPAA
jgi:2-polyprenyl-6-methoxyphenol hydroxylase-like FAD-dependent oxidoreductase